MEIHKLTISLRVAHDNLVQDIIRDIVQKKINPKSDGYTMTDAELKRAFEIYNEDMKKAEKRYTINNIPAAYALISSKYGAGNSCLLWRSLYG